MTSAPAVSSPAPSAPPALSITITHFCVTYGELVDVLPVVDLCAVQAGQLQLVATRLRLDDLRVVSVTQQDLRGAARLDGLKGGGLGSSGTEWVLLLEIQLVPVFHMSVR